MIFYMTKELQDRAWAILPKEFKEEVKEMFEEDKKHPEIRTTCGITTAYHNDMGQRLIDLFGLHNLTSDAEGDEMLTVPRKAIIQAYEKSCAKRATKYDVGYADCLYNLFGSKCLPDEEPKQAEPKNEGTHQEQYVPKNAESGTHSLNRILKDGFREHNRLHIAAMAMQGVVANGCISSPDEIAKYSFAVADALITAAEGGAKLNLSKKSNSSEKLNS